MAYQLRYYKRFESQGVNWNLSFYQDTTETIEATTIGPVLQGLRLVMQGDQASVDTPIVKTSLEMTFVDAPDIEGDEKTGFWEEFYTSSATEWKVMLWKNGIVEWTGYITPDSFSETLQYRGSVSLIARDNLGTLQDVTFDGSTIADAYRRCYFWNILQEGFAASGCAMSLYYRLNNSVLREIDVEAEYDDAHLLDNITIPVSKLEGMSWWDVLEKTLYSLGLVMRYFGANRILVIPLRDLPKMGNEYWWEVNQKEVQFLSYGNRELMYGIKEINEVQEFAKEEKYEEQYHLNDYHDQGYAQMSHNTTFYVYQEDGTDIPYSDMVIPVNGYTKDSLSCGAENSNLLDVRSLQVLEGESTRYGSWDDDGIIYMAANTVSAEGEYELDKSKIVEIIAPVTSANDVVTFNFTLDRAVAVTLDGTKVMNFPRFFYYQNDGLSPSFQLYYCIKEYNSETGVETILKDFYTYGLAPMTADGRPTPEQVTLQANPSGPGIVTLQLKGIEWQDNYEEGWEAPPPRLRLRLFTYCKGMYFRIKDIKTEVTFVEEDVTKIIERNVFKTKYSDKYAVRLDRNPEFAINQSDSPIVTFMDNALLTRTTGGLYKGADQWVWMGRRTSTEGLVGSPLTQIIHQQLLAYYAKPNNILTGELMDKNGAFPDFGSLWLWNGKQHMLTSGTLNILTGRIESAVLREFTRYDHMWETWVEEEDTKIDEDLGNIASLTVHTLKEPADITVTNLPDWLWVSMKGIIYTGLVGIEIAAEENTTGAERSAIIVIDGTASVRIKQDA